MLKINNISFSYNKDKLLDNISISLKEGDRLGIVGPSGSGKSTILRLIAGLEKSSKGEIIIKDKDVTNIPTEKRNIGYLFQNYALFPFLNNKKNILFGIKHLSKKEQDIRLKEVTELLKIEELLSKYPNKISGGQKQRIALARTLVTRPDVLLLDEPFSALDTELKNSIREELNIILDKYNITTVMVTHDKEDITAICNSEYTLKVL